MIKQRSLQTAELAYRVRQFRAALRATVSPAEYALVATTLSPGEQRLFALMPRYDQRHCLDVYNTLVAAGHTDPILLRAALIHDCGKVNDADQPMSLNWYVGVTVLKRFPGLYLAMARIGGATGPVAIYAEHAARGARMAAAVGAPAELCAILRHYHDPAPTGAAAVLQWADDQQ